MKRRNLYSILMLVCVIGFWLFENFYTPDTYSSSEGRATDLPASLMPSSTTNNIVTHNHYSLSYHEQYEQAEWVAYTLKKSHLTYDDRKRPYFIEDPRVKTKSADWRNYKGSGYDRGHLCPAGDRRFTEQAYNETFYTSNISPQDSDFNAGVWNRLEKLVRQWAKRYDELFVVTGGVLEKSLNTIGDEDVAIPKYYYKIISKGNKNNPEVIAFLFPHYESFNSLQSFVVSIDELEQMTGIDFFKKLPQATQNNIEQKSSSKGWSF